MAYTSVVLIILDGWGVGPPWGGNAIAQAKTPFFDTLNRQPHAILEASGNAVGLSGHEAGNSEVGHLNLGAGRVVLQDSTRITRALAAGALTTNPVLNQAFAGLKASGKRLHLMGLLSSATVHADQQHGLALIQRAKEAGVADIRIHLFTDGRDSDPRDGLALISTFEEALAKLGGGTIQTIVGRYWAMDRDHHWDRTARAYELIMFGKSTATAATARAAVSQSYASGVTDEFIEPTVITSTAAELYRGVAPDDALIFWNFRSDRARQLTRACTEANFTEFARIAPPRLTFLTLTPYGAEHHLSGVQSVFRPEPLPQTLAAVISERGQRQYHVAETEKYAHVTYFFNGGIETALPGERRTLVPSPTVATYDLKPAMAAAEITAALSEAIKQQRETLIVANFANADMVGHTGNFQAATEAVEVIDRALEALSALARRHTTPLLITADHGNIEQMVNPLTGEPATDHTANPVPCYVLLPETLPPVRPTGILADVAPTILELLGMDQPPEMTGKSLLHLDT